MNKKANKKAFFVLAGIGCLYMMIALDITHMFSMERTGGQAVSPAVQSLGIAGGTRDEAPPVQKTAAIGPSSALEPSLFISVPLVFAAIEEGFVEKEGLVLIKRDNGTRSDFKKPMDILENKDEEGLKKIAEMLGKKRLVHLLNKENISVKDDMEAAEIMLGKGYTVDRKVLLAMYDRHVPAACSGLFPFACGDREIAKSGKGFVITSSEKNGPDGIAAGREEWVVPDLTNLSMMAAIGKVSAHTSKIRVSGSGFVVDQTPRAYEKVRGEVECRIYGRQGEK